MTTIISLKPFFFFLLYSGNRRCYASAWLPEGRGEPGISGDHSRKGQYSPVTCLWQVARKISGRELLHYTAAQAFIPGASRMPTVVIEPKGYAFSPSRCLPGKEGSGVEKSTSWVDIIRVQKTAVDEGLVFILWGVNLCCKACFHVI